MQLSEQVGVCCVNATGPHDCGRAGSCAPIDPEVALKHRCKNGGNILSVEANSKEVADTFRSHVISFTSGHITQSHNSHEFVFYYQVFISCLVCLDFLFEFQCTVHYRHFMLLHQDHASQHNADFASKKVAIEMCSVRLHRIFSAS